MRPIRRVHVSPIKPSVRKIFVVFFSIHTNLKLTFLIQMWGDIEKYFKQFGEVEDVYFRTAEKTEVEYCYVQFYTTDGAEAALKNATHFIGGFTVRVQAAYDNCKPDLNSDDDYCWDSDSNCDSD